MKDPNRGHAFAVSSQDFLRVDRRINSAQRNFQNALKHLMALRAMLPHTMRPPELDAEAALIPFLVPTPDAPMHDAPAATQTPDPPVPETATEELNPKLVLIRTSVRPIETSPDTAEKPANTGLNDRPAKSEDNKPPIEAPDP
jgi:hypothetical protein